MNGQRALKIPVFLDERINPTTRKCRRCRTAKKLRMFRVLSSGPSIGITRTWVCIECEDAYWRKAYRYGR